jgi:hypothetical protein
MMGRLRGIARVRPGVYQTIAHSPPLSLRPTGSSRPRDPSQEVGKQRARHQLARRPCSDRDTPFLAAIFQTRPGMAKAASGQHNRSLRAAGASVDLDP